MSNITTEILVRFFENTATKEENDAIADWIESDPAHQEIFNRELQMHLQLLNLRALDDAPVRTSSTKSGIRRVAIVAGVAAALVAGVLLSWFLGVAPLREEASRMLAFHTEPGQRASLTLPDGTSVELNSGSTLEYPAVFSKRERRVRIEGEAMFDVAEGGSRPFYVETFAYDVKVLGTRFNVEADEVAGIFSTALIEGSVAILDKQETEIVALEPDHLVVLYEGRLVKKQARNIEARYRWTDGIINCNGLSFGDLMRKFEKAFGVNIVIACESVPEVSYQRMKINVCDGISHAFSLLQRTADFSVEYDDTTNTYLITR